MPCTETLTNLRAWLVLRLTFHRCPCDEDDGNNSKASGAKLYRGVHRPLGPVVTRDSTAKKILPVRASHTLLEPLSLVKTMPPFSRNMLMRPSRCGVCAAADAYAFCYSRATRAPVYRITGNKQPGGGCGSCTGTSDDAPDRVMPTRGRPVYLPAVPINLPRLCAIPRRVCARRRAGHYCYYCYYYNCYSTAEQRRLVTAIKTRTHAQQPRRRRRFANNNKRGFRGWRAGLVRFAVCGEQ